MSSKEERIKNIILFCQAISLFILLVGLFLGSLYAFGGNLFIAIPLSVTLVLAIYYFLDHLIGLKMERKRTGFSFGAKALIGLFIIVSVPSTILVVHALNIEILEKEEIQKIGENKINELTKIKTNYKNTYESYLKKEELFYMTQKSDLDASKNIDKIAAKLGKRPDNIKELFSGGSVAIRKHVYKSEDNFKSTLENKKMDAFIKRNTEIIKNWDRFRINSSFNIIEENSLKFCQDLKIVIDKYKSTRSDSINTFIDKGTEPFECVNKTAKNDTMLEQPINLLIKHAGIYFFVFVVLIYSIMLLPYFAAPSIKYGTPTGPSGNGNDNDNDKGPIVY